MRPLGPHVTLASLVAQPAQEEEDEGDDVSDAGTDIFSAADAAVSSYLKSTPCTAGDAVLTRGSVVGGARGSVSAQSLMRGGSVSMSAHVCVATFDFTLAVPLESVGFSLAPSPFFAAGGSHAADEHGDRSRDGIDRFGADTSRMGLSPLAPWDDTRVVSPFALTLAAVQAHVPTGGMKALSPAAVHNRDTPFACCRRLRPGLLLTHVNGRSLAHTPARACLHALSSASPHSTLRLTFMYHPLAALRRAYDVLAARAHVCEWQRDAVAVALSHTLQQVRMQLTRARTRECTLVNAYMTMRAEAAAVRADVVAARALAEDLRLDVRDAEARIQYLSRTARGTMGGLGRRNLISSASLGPSADAADDAGGGKDRQAPAAPAAIDTAQEHDAHDVVVSPQAAFARRLFDVSRRFGATLGSTISATLTPTLGVSMTDSLKVVSDPLYPLSHTLQAAGSELGLSRPAPAASAAKPSGVASLVCDDSSAPTLLQYLNTLASASTDVRACLDTIFAHPPAAPSLAEAPPPPPPLTLSRAQPSVYGGHSARPSRAAGRLIGSAELSIEAYRLLAALSQREAALELAESACERASTSENALSAARAALEATCRSLEASQERIDALEHCLAETNETLHKRRASAAVAAPSSSAAPVSGTSGALVAPTASATEGETSAAGTRLRPSLHKLQAAVHNIVSAVRSGQAGRASGAAAAPTQVDAMTLWERYKSLQQRTCMQEDAINQKVAELERVHARVRSLFTENEVMASTAAGKGIVLPRGTPVPRAPNARKPTRDERERMEAKARRASSGPAALQDLSVEDAAALADEDGGSPALAAAPAGRAMRSPRASKHSFFSLKRKSGAAAPPPPPPRAVPAAVVEVVGEESDDGKEEAVHRVEPGDELVPVSPPAAAPPSSVAPSSLAGSMSLLPDLELPFDFNLGRAALLSYEDGPYPGGTLREGTPGIVLALEMHKRSRAAGPRASWSKWEWRYVVVAFGCILYFKSAFDSRPQKTFSLDEITSFRALAEEGAGAQAVAGPVASSVASKPLPFVVELHLSSRKVYQFAARDAEARGAWYGMLAALPVLRDARDKAKARLAAAGGGS